MKKRKGAFNCFDFLGKIIANYYSFPSFPVSIDERERESENKICLVCFGFVYLWEWNSGSWFDWHQTVIIA